VFSPDILAVSTGDNVTIYFYNIDPTERHTFTMGAPYNIDKDLAGGENATIRFKAGEEGVYRFYCKYHQPTMTGQLIVLPPPVVEKATNTTTTTTK
jgi:plastocyanin